MFKGLLKSRRNKREEKRRELIESALSDCISTQGKNAFCGDLEEDKALLMKLFENVETLRVRELTNSHDDKLKFCLFYCDGLVDSMLMSKSLVTPLLNAEIERKGEIGELLLREVIQSNEAQRSSELIKAIEAITYGDTVLLVSGSKEALILNTKGFKTRGVSEPDSERVLTGPREGFNENIMTNLSLLQRRLRTPDFKIKFMRVGRRSNTTLCVCYLDGIVNKSILEELYSRLGRIDIDGVLDTNYITELIRDAPWSPFRATGYTERPDVAVGRLLEGRIAVLVDGTCNVLTMPYLFIENFQSSEDYYLSFFYTSVSRLLRILGFCATVITPGLYIAVVAFHREMLPQPLLINIATDRQSVPLPAAIEAIVMIVVFDILRETGVRMPSSIGQALGIVGALVIGQAAVEAKLIASPMIIVIGFTGITNLLVPKMNAPVIYLRMALLVLSSMFGFFGLMIGFLMALMHIFNLTSMGVPQISRVDSLHYQHVKDSFFRAPWWDMLTRPRALTRNTRRMKKANGGKTHA